MSDTHRFLFLIGGVVTLFALSCGDSSKQEYDVDKTSPDGVYRVKIEVRTKPPKGTREYTEHAKFQFLKGQEVIHEYEGEETDKFEPSFHDSYPVIEWVDNNVLRMGKEHLGQPFYDELIVSNNTEEHIKYLDVSYGKNEMFWVFDLAPRSQVTLQASPGLNGTVFNYSLGYGGATESGREFHDAMESKKRKTIADGPLKFQITITPRDLQK